MRDTALLIPLAAALAGLLLVGCERTVSDRDLVLIEYHPLRELQRQAEAAGEPDRVVIVDVRSAQAYTEGHIPGAIHLRLGELARRDPRLERARHIVVYGRDWQDPRGPAAAKRLIKEGYSRVLDFRGGVELWEARGGDLVQTPDASADE